MAFKTAVFYDIENLLKGYSFSQQLIMNLSLKEILKTAKENYNLEGLAVQRPMPTGVTPGWRSCAGKSMNWA